MFSPFKDSKTNHFNFADIEYLKEARVAEGLFVEYKSALPESRKIANSVASFVNSYGGWYILGIDADKTTNTPANLVGLEDCSDPVSTVRDVIIAHLDPIPRFFIETVEGTNGEMFVIIQVPDGQNKPCISKDGRVYRRMADSSSPIIEGNRAAIDRIVDEGRDQRRKFIAFCKDHRTYSKGETNPWVHIYIRPYPDIAESDIPWTISEIKALLNEISLPVSLPYGDTELNTTLPFDSGHLSAGGVVLRQVSGARVDQNRLSLELFGTGWCKIHLPLPIFGHIGPSSLKSIRSAEVLEVFQELWNQDATTVRLVEVGQVFASAGSLVGQYLRWIGGGFDSEYEYRLEVDDAWRVVPFYDSPKWRDFVDDCGIPIVTQDRISLPTSLEGTILAKNELNFPLWLNISSEILRCLGLPFESSLNSLSNILEKAK